MAAGPSGVTPLERERRAQELLAEALDREPSERAAWLADACGGDGELRAMVEELLAWDAAEPPPLKALPAALLRDAAPVEATVTGERVYRLLSELGRGGFGSVFLAERADGAYRQRVAVKRLNLGAFASPASLARLRLERQILARLTHPHIARLLDGGEMADGAPFLVLEYIDGEPIDSHCARHGLSLGERLRLFLAVCAAVEFAHKNLVVHRDLKPGNVLVDTAGEVKLLDFGIAKLLDPEAAADGLETRKGESPLTPRYASPEQVRGEAVTTATDVYSLGVLLFELLSGRSPYRAGATPFELARAVCETDPPRPSSLPRAAYEGSRLDADLDAVVLKAMRKEPGERYGSVRALAEDVERYIAGLPVLARKGSAAYRFGKLVRRRKLAFAGGAAVLLLVAGFSVSLAVQLAETERQRDAARRERDAAEAVTDFLVDTFRVADPTAARDREVTARQLLDRGAARIDQTFADRPETRARLLVAMGRAYRELGSLPEAERLLTAALSLREQLAAEDDEGLAEASLELGRLRENQARFDEARPLLTRALAIRERTLPEDDPRLAEAITNLANIGYRTGRYGEAAPLFERALQVARRRGDPLQLARPLNNLANVEQRLGRYERAAALYQECLQVLERAYGPDHPLVGHPLNNLGMVRVLQGRAAEAQPLFARALAIWQKAFPGDHPLVAWPLSNLGVVEARAGRAEAARDLFRRALAMREATVGPDHPDAAVTLQDWADLELTQGRPAEAAAHYRRALAIREKSFGPDHPEVAQSLHGLGMALRAQGEASAPALLERALAIRRATLPADHPDRRASEAAAPRISPG